jgi:hypothetical protein
MTSPNFVDSISNCKRHSHAAADVLNFSRNQISYPLPAGLKAGSLLLANSDAKEEKATVLHLSAWGARVYRL